MSIFNLYFIRHGLAVERNDTDPDCDRTLTEEGKAKTKQVAKRLYELGLRFQAIHTSPFIRARQTSEIFGIVFDIEPEILTDLAPQSNPGQNFDQWLDRLLQWRLTHPEASSLGIIGHEPDLSTWAEMLLWGGTRDALVLKKAGIIGLSLPDHQSPIGESFLFLLLPPKLIV
jgi:phosphohistidine phosphatase